MVIRYSQFGWLTSNSAESELIHVIITVYHFDIFIALQLADCEVIALGNDMTNTIEKGEEIHKKKNISPEKNVWSN